MMDTSVAAGQYKRRNNPGPISDLFKDHSTQYGPSNAAYTTWKKSGVPTADTMQQQTFGMSSKTIGSAREALTAAEPPSPQQPQLPFGKRHEPRANPITWMGGPEEPAFKPRPVYSDGRNVIPLDMSPRPPPQQQISPNRQRQRRRQR